ncbi:MAG: A/G-specific adenine glycosylase [Rhodospirillaceae bacterium]|nr:A/G-specific adenine glycosylase [Rhodospirillaceae bacterium]MBT5457539.1 A/G-specific adenine glycosylase [Rhodospirillaceae bacterium]
MQNKQTSHNQKVTPVRARRLRSALLHWYDRHRRVMPWRAPPGRKSEPYHVWLSEIMLQQTTVVTVGPYFERFLARWPTVEDLAVADLDHVLHGWQGLGYYARARNLHRCARVICDDHDGQFPDTQDALLALPGIGDYTAAAITAIAFDHPASVVDGNVERVMARMFAIEELLPAIKPTLKDLAAGLAPGKEGERSGDYAQALMDLGATVCTPRKPACGRCPWAESCKAVASGIAETLPRRAPKKEKPTRKGVAFWAVSPEGRILLRRRPEKGLLGGMMEVPSTEWREDGWTHKAARSMAPLKADWTALPGQVRHTFTHFHLELEIFAAHVPPTHADGIWCLPDRFGEHALPTVMKKIVAHALKTG